MMSMGVVESVRGSFSKRFGHSKFRSRREKSFLELRERGLLGGEREKKKRLKRKGLVERGERVGYSRR